MMGVSHPLNVAAISDDDVDWATGVIGIFIHPVCPLIRMHMAEESEIHSMLVKHVLNLLLVALHFLVMAHVSAVAAATQVSQSVSQPANQSVDYPVSSHQGLIR